MFTQYMLIGVLQSGVHMSVNYVVDWIGEVSARKMLSLTRKFVVSFLSVRAFRLVATSGRVFSYWLTLLDVLCAIAASSASCHVNTCKWTLTRAFDNDAGVGCIIAGQWGADCIT